jgi:hypothetical protein
MKSAQAEQINKGITAAVQLADLVCGDDLRAGKSVYSSNVL